MTPFRLIALAALTFGLFWLFPEIDLWVGALGYTPGQGFVLGKQAPFEPLHDAVPWLVAMIPLGGLIGWRLGRLKGRAALFLLLAVVLGPGVLANAVFKDNWGRARPAQVQELGGTREFTPVAILSDQCQRNCSFVSGDAAGGFAFIAPALLAPLAWRRRAVLAGIGVGLIFGANRIFQGGHFLSDVLFAGYVVGGTVWALHWAMFGGGAAARFRDWCALQKGSAWGRWRLAALGLIPAAMVSAAFLDRNFAVAMRGLDPQIHKVFAVITHLGDGLGWLSGSALLTLWCAFAAWRGADPVTVERWRGRAWAAGFFFVACASAGLASSVLKFLFGRARPKLFFRDGIYEFAFFRTPADWVSMPSGHTIMSLAVATALACLWPRWSLWIYAVGILAAVSRLIITAHWLSDVMIGTLVGTGMVLAVRHILTTNGIYPGPGLGAAGRWQWQGSLSKGLGLVSRPANK